MILCFVWLIPVDSNSLSTYMSGEYGARILIGISGPLPENIYVLVRFPIGIPNFSECAFSIFFIMDFAKFDLMFFIAFVFVVMEIISPASF